MRVRVRPPPRRAR